MKTYAKNHLFVALYVYFSSLRHNHNRLIEINETAAKNKVDFCDAAFREISPYGKVTRAAIP